MLTSDHFCGSQHADLNPLLSGMQQAFNLPSRQTDPPNSTTEHYLPRQCEILQQDLNGQPHTLQHSESHSTHLKYGDGSMCEISKVNTWACFQLQLAK
jgi:hypothetical protein